MALVVILGAFLDPRIDYAATAVGTVWAQHNEFHRGVIHLGHHVLPTPGPCRVCIRQSVCVQNPIVKRTSVMDHLGDEHWIVHGQLHAIDSITLTVLANPFHCSVVLLARAGDVSTYALEMGNIQGELWRAGSARDCGR